MAVPVDRSRSSPNHGVRRSGYARPDSIVLHYTGMRDGPSAIAWLCDPRSEVSSHYVVAEDGAVLELVDEAQRAWHAGRGSWAGETDMNSASVGIEIVNGGHDYGLPDFPDRQIEAVAALCREIMTRHAIRPERVLAHSDIAPGRKRDPGERFPWRRLHDLGVGFWAEPSLREERQDPLGPGDHGDAVERWQQDLARFGYGLAVTALYDELTATVVQAFQRRYRPGLIDGVADEDTQSRLAALSKNLVG